VKTLALVVPVALAFSPPALAQQKPLNFKVLQEALPTAQLPGFTRNKPTGSTSSAMGMSSSEAAVRYEKPGSGGEEISITAKVADLIGVPMAAMAFAVVPMVDQESETESGYQKTVTVRKKYRATEEASTGESKSCKLMIPIMNRFMVELEGNGTSDAKLLHKLLEGMALEKLEAAAAGK